MKSYIVNKRNAPFFDETFYAASADLALHQAAALFCVSIHDLLPARETNIEQIITNANELGIKLYTIITDQNCIHPYQTLLSDPYCRQNNKKPSMLGFFDTPQEAIQTTMAHYGNGIHYVAPEIFEMLQTI